MSLLKNLSLASAAAILSAFGVAKVASAATFSAKVNFSLLFPQAVTNEFGFSIFPTKFSDPASDADFVGNAFAASPLGSSTSGSTGGQVSRNISLGEITGNAGPGFGRSFAISKGALLTKLATFPGESFTGFIQGTYSYELATTVNGALEQARADVDISVNGVKIVADSIIGSNSSNQSGTFSIPINLSPTKSLQSFNIQAFIAGSADSVDVPPLPPNPPPTPDPLPVPEPLTILGSGAALGIGIWFKKQSCRRLKKQGLS